MHNVHVIYSIFSAIENINNMSAQGGVCLPEVVCICLGEGYLPGGCVSGQGVSAWGCVWPGGVCLPRGLCLVMGVCDSARGGVCTPAGQTDTCENITFPQLLLWTVIILTLQTTVFQALMIETKKLNHVSTQISLYNMKTIIGKMHAKTSLSSVAMLTTRNNSN